MNDMMESNLTNSNDDNKELNASTVWNLFSTKFQDIQNRLKIEPFDINDIQLAKGNLHELQKFATSHVSYMPAYDVRRTQEQIEILAKDIKSLESTLQPKKKFTFASRNKTSTINKMISQKQAFIESEETVASTFTSEESTANTWIIQNKVDEFITITREQVYETKDYDNVNIMKQILIVNCKGTKISAQLLIGSIRIEHCEDCIIFLGPCCTSSYLEGLKNCTIVCASHQLRIHTCDSCKLFVRANSHPIIEDCKNMGFAPFDLTYNGIDEEFQVRLRKFDFIPLFDDSM